MTKFATKLGPETSATNRSKKAPANHHHRATKQIL
jgi:hypothetical protein